MGVFFYSLLPQLTPKTLRTVPTNDAHESTPRHRLNSWALVSRWYRSVIALERFSNGVVTGI